MEYGKITSWTLIQVKSQIEKSGQKIEGTCTTCPNALWNSVIADGKAAQESREIDNVRYFWVDADEVGKDLIVYCFCTLTHAYQGARLAFCDGNTPDEPPSL